MSECGGVCVSVHVPTHVPACAPTAAAVCVCVWGEPEGVWSLEGMIYSALQVITHFKLNFLPV